MSILDSSLELCEVVTKCSYGTCCTLNTLDVITWCGYHVILQEIKLFLAAQCTIGGILSQSLIKLVFIIEHSLIIFFLIIRTFVVNSDMSAKNMTSLIISSINILTNFPIPSIIECSVDIYWLVRHHFNTFLCQCWHNRSYWRFFEKGAKGKL